MSAGRAGGVYAALRCWLVAIIGLGALSAGCRPSDEGGGGTVDARALPSATTASAAASHVAEVPKRPCAPEMAQIGGFCVDLWEAHLLQADGRTHPHNERPKAGERYRAGSAAGVLPQAYLSRGQAQAACQQAEKRLCSLSEWRQACQGPSGWRYPYGNDRRGGVCNSGKDHLMKRFFGNNPLAWTQDAFNDPRLLAEPGFVAETGSLPGCVSAQGVYDLVGNVHEWVADTVSNQTMNEMAAERVYRRSQPWRYGNGMFLGGFFSTRDELGPGCLFTTVAHKPRYHDYSIGFRCCADARSTAVSSQADPR